MTDRREIMRFVDRSTDAGGFQWFVGHVFSASFPRFVGGQYVQDVAGFLQDNYRGLRVCPRDHFKSASFYAYVMWQLFTHPDEDFRVHYFSYKDALAQYHISKLRGFIAANPYFQDIITDEKPTAEGVAKYTWDDEHHVYIEPHGMLSFKRGIHDRVILVDDPFQDPANKLDPVTVTRINEVVKTQILDMPTQDGVLFIQGTPQTNSDFFFDKALHARFATFFRKAEVDKVREIALWPEWMPWRELQMRRLERGDKVFDQEYNCNPAYSADAWFHREQIYGLAVPELKNATETGHPDHSRIGGWDVGKHQHPAHFTVLENRDGVLWEIYEQWMDSWEYRKQVEHVKAIVETLGVDRVFFDNTRGELETYLEDGTLSRGTFKPVVFGVKSKHSLATALDKVVTAKPPALKLQAVERTLNQLLVVTNDMEAVETHEGHGDAFWSIAMAVHGFEQAGEVGLLESLPDTSNRTEMRRVLDWSPRF